MGFRGESHLWSLWQSLAGSCYNEPVPPASPPARAPVGLSGLYTCEDKKLTLSASMEQLQTWTSKRVLTCKHLAFKYGSRGFHL